MNALVEVVIVKPRRVQLSRRKGWRMPPNTIKVDRSTKWGNPYRFGNPAICVEMFEAHLQRRIGVFFRGGFVNTRDVRKELRGKNLACWCALDAPCHADILLRIANS